MHPTPHDWLANTYWYCPEESLLAIRTRTSRELTWVADQTVWWITGAERGYFWGVASAVVTPEGEDPDVANKTDMSLFGSITPAGRVHITFTTSTPTVGLGRLLEQDGEALFSMQMSAGSLPLLTVHWAYMRRVRPQDPQWSDLPGLGVAVPDMVGDLSPPRLSSRT